MNSTSVSPLHLGLRLLPAMLLVGTLVAAPAAADRSVRIVNPSFEADSFSIPPGYVNANGAITGWGKIGAVGLNNAAGPPGSSPFANYGEVPDGGQVAFLQTYSSSREAELRQTVQGLDPNRMYWLQLYVNKRFGFANPTGHVDFAGVNVIDDAGVSTAIYDYYPVHRSFWPAASAGDLVIRSGLITDDSDRALLVDGITLIQRDPDEIILYNPSFEARGTYGYVQPKDYEPRVAGWTSNGGVGIQTAASSPDGDNFARLYWGRIEQPSQGLTPGAFYEMRLSYRISPDDFCYPTASANFGGQYVEFARDPNGGFLEHVQLFRATSTTGTISVEANDCAIDIDDISVRPASPIRTTNWAGRSPLQGFTTAVTPTGAGTWLADSNLGNLRTDPEELSGYSQGSHPSVALIATTPRFWVTNRQHASAIFAIEYDGNLVDSPGLQGDSFTLSVCNALTGQCHLPFYSFSNESYENLMSLQQGRSILKNIPLPLENFDDDELDDPLEIRIRQGDDDGRFTIGQVTVSNLVIDGTSPYPLADANLDYRVDGQDMAILVSNYGKQSFAAWGDGNFSQDGRVDIRDLMVLRRHLGETWPTARSAAAVPEPYPFITAAQALAVSLLWALAQSRRRRSLQATTLT